MNDSLKKKIYAFLILIPIILAIIGGLLINIYYDDIYGYSPIIGVSATAIICVVLVFLIYYNVKRIKDISKEKKSE